MQVRALLVLQPSSPVALLLKTQLEVLRQQPKKAFKALGPLLTTISDCTPRYAEAEASYSAAPSCRGQQLRPRDMKLAAG
jgi:hypothetical protein